MPYIHHSRRTEIAAGAEIKTAGELNYAITKLLVDYMGTHPAGYQEINDVLGAIEGAKLEFQRRVVAPYEDSKIRQNGDVY